MNIRWLAATVITGAVCAAVAGSGVWWFTQDTSAEPDRVVGINQNQVQVRTNKGSVYTAAVPNGTWVVLGMTWPGGRLSEPQVVGKTGLWCHYTWMSGSTPTTGLQFDCQTRYIGLGMIDSWWTLYIKDRDGHVFTQDVPATKSYQVGDVWIGTK